MCGKQVCFLTTFNNISLCNTWMWPQLMGFDVGVIKTIRGIDNCLEKMKPSIKCVKNECKATVQSKIYN